MPAAFLTPALPSFRRRPGAGRNPPFRHSGAGRNPVGYSSHSRLGGNDNSFSRAESHSGHPYRRGLIQHPDSAPLDSGLRRNDDGAGGRFVATLKHRSQSNTPPPPSWIPRRLVPDAALPPASMQASLRWNDNGALFPHLGNPPLHHPAPPLKTKSPTKPSKAVSPARQ